MIINKKILLIFIILIMIVFSTGFIYRRYFEKSSKERFLSYLINDIDLRKFDPGENATLDYFVEYEGPIKGFIRVLRGEVPFSESDIEPFLKEVNKKFDEQCVIGKKNNCSITHVLTPYTLVYLSHLIFVLNKTNPIPLETRKATLLNNTKFVKAVDYWADYFCSKELDGNANELGDFADLIFIMTNTGLINQSEKNCLLQKLVNTKIQKNDVFAKHHKMHAFQILTGINFLDDMNQTIMNYTKEKAEQEICENLPSISELKNENDACMGYYYIRIQEFCTSTYHIHLFNKFKELRYWYFNQRYDDIWQLDCQLILLPVPLDPTVD